MMSQYVRCQHNGKELYSLISAVPYYDMWISSSDVSLVADVNECASLPCHHGGSCVDEVNKDTCICPTGYTGEFCETGEPTIPCAVMHDYTRYTKLPFTKHSHINADVTIPLQFQML